MPEVIIRLLTDAISDYLSTPSPDADENLKKEAIPEDKIFFVGDLIADSLLINLDKPKKSKILGEFGLEKELSSDYALLTLHRPSNGNDPESLHNILEAPKKISKEIPLIFPIHPRIRKQVKLFGFHDYFVDIKRVKLPTIRHGRYCIEQLGHLDFLKLVIHSKFMMTDSDGIHEEFTVLGIPGLTHRDKTERPMTISQGTNTLVHNDTERIVREAYRILDGNGIKCNCRGLWAGRSVERIVETIACDR